MIAALLFLSAAVFVLGTGVGLLRLPDSLSRLHASTKAASLGTALAMAAVLVEFRTPWAWLLAVLTPVFVFLTAPVGAHAVATRTAAPPAGDAGERDPAAGTSASGEG
jgi:multicomponent Na+:H+ antiporter subunit G